MARQPAKPSTAASSKTATKPGKTPANPPPAGATRSKANASSPFPVVGIGASAGGLEALKELLEDLPADTGMAFVIVTHQHPGHISLLPELLGKMTAMPVKEAADGVKLQADHVYLSPPGGHLALRRGRLYSMETPAKEALRLPIDYFFRSLAEDRKERAVCIVLSGTGSDGTLGLKAIKGQTGMAMVQQPQTARYSGMPSSAIATGMADYVLPLAAMPRQLQAYAAGAYVPAARAAPSGAEQLDAGADPAPPLAKILLLLQSRTGHDFSAYKTSTIRRRLERRMHVHQFQKSADYLRYLQDSPVEIDALFRDLLINVTSFFRNPEIFDALCKHWLAKYLAQLPEHSVLRVWVPGCASGEEVYSLAIVLHEHMERAQRHFDVQIFGTDLDAEAIDTARKGLYSDGIAADVTAPRLERYFSREDGGYRIAKEIRRMAIFAPQSLVRDPPFTRLDLVSCRNVLIYMNADLQQKLLATFCYALKPGGLLTLGSAESLGAADSLFDALDLKCKIYRRKAGPLPQLPAIQRRAQARSAVLPETATAHLETQLPNLIERLLLARFVPASIVCNERGDIVHLHGRTGTLLEPAQGRPRMNVLEMAREGLKRPLAYAMRRASAEGKEVLSENILVKTNGDSQRLDLVVAKLSEPEALRGLLIATFRESVAHTQGPRAGASSKVRPGKPPPDYVGELERELERATESLQSTVEQLETANEELISANEELQSTNEEMQSGTEELETSQEELQSLNEELHAVNSELRLKVELLSRTSDDMQNLLDSTDIATVFLDRRLNIKSYTETTKGLISLIPTDAGRPIGDLVSKLKYPALTQDCQIVLKTLVGKVTEIETTDGAWYLARILPYRTLDHAIDGLVLTFDNIDALKSTQRAAAASRAWFESVVNTVRELLLVLDGELRVVRANRSFYRLFGLDPRQVEGVLIYQLAHEAWDIPQLRRLLGEILPRDDSFDDFELTHEFPRLGPRRFLLNARRLQRAEDLPGMILLAMEDVTDRSAAP